MKKFTLILVCNILLLQGCTIPDGEKSTSNSQKATPQPVGENQPQPANNQAQAQQKEPEKSNILASSETIPGLLPSTNPQQRERATSKGRKDPFGLINVQPSVGYSSTGSPGEGKAPNVALPHDNIAQGTYCRRSFKEGSTYSDPQPNEARAVLVSGILNVEGQNFAIIKTPEYGYSYRVKEGSTISNGQVLVKNINFLVSPPLVTLEQNGQEVIIGVGEASSSASVGLDSQDSDLVVLIHQGPEFYGRVRGLMLTKIDLKQAPIAVSNETESGGQPPAFTARVFGTLCNDSNKVITVSTLRFQIEDTKGIVLDSTSTSLGGHGFILKPGQTGEFDTTLQLRNRLGGNVNIKLRDWS